MKDTLGQELRVGDMVAYGARSGNTGELRLAIVTNTEKNAIVSGNMYQRWENGKNTGEYALSCSGAQGMGVHGSRLLRLNPLEYPKQYDVLVEKAKKYLL